ncbi:MAG: hypothetical protein RDV41_05800 [Planctomycetota bacterium]|nr:hypothetical protein [Planctomycetota bacterium]
MAKTMTLPGLCTTCDNTPACSLRKRRREGVVQCEEFAVPPARICRSVARNSRPSGSLRKVSRYMGLCSNCEQVRTCKFPKPAGGVWSCEEYR